MSVKLPKLDNDVLSLILENIQPLERAKYSRVSKQWYAIVGILRRRKTPKIIHCEEKLTQLKSEKKRLKTEIYQLYRERDKYKYNNTGFYRMLMHEIITEYNRIFGPSEGYVDGPALLSAAICRIREVTICYKHSKKCGRFDIHDGAPCWCPIDTAVLCFSTNVGKTLGYYDDLIHFTSKYYLNSGWDGIDPTLTLEDFHGQPCARIHREFTDSSNYTHVLEHVFQRVINHKIVWRDYMQRTSSQAVVIRNASGTRVNVNQQPFFVPLSGGPGGRLVLPNTCEE